MSRVKQLREKRSDLAHSLVETLHDIERQSGIFLIKPIYSYQGRGDISDHLNRVNRVNRARSAAKRTSSSTAVIAGGIKTGHLDHHQRLQLQLLQQQRDSIKSKSDTAFSPRQSNWNIDESRVNNETATGGGGGGRSSSAVNTPKILEIDINRINFMNNNVSSNDGSNLMSPMFVNRPNLNYSRKDQLPPINNQHHPDDQDQQNEQDQEHADESVVLQLSRANTDLLKSPKNS